MKSHASICGSGFRAAPAFCLALGIFAPIARTQARDAASLRGAASLTSSGRAALDLNRPDPPDLLPSDLLREIDDPGLGRRWLLYRDARHPEGPGRLVAAGALRLNRPNAASSPLPGSTAVPIPVIRAGDRVVLEESTPIVEARLEAIALVPASKGSPLKVRLVLGGKVVPAIAIAPGRVKLAAPPESRP
jgi:hypothetical protein